MCSKAMPPQIHALFNLILYALQLDISPSLYLILLFSPRLTPPDFSFFALPPSRRLSCVPLWGPASFLQKFFLKQEKEKLSGSARKPSHLGGGAAEGTLK